MSKIEYENWSREIFQGFYESELYYSDIESDFNCDCDEVRELKDWKGFTTTVAQDCTACLWQCLNQEQEIIKSIEYKGLYSPKYYNFETDKLELVIDCDIEALKTYCFKDNCGDFDLYLYENFTSYDGFVSFVPNNLKEFYAKYEDDTERLLNVMIEFYLLQNLDLLAYRDSCAEWARQRLCEYMEPVEAGNE
jgi:hypothetical protein